MWSLTGFFAGFIYPAWCAIYSETAEMISPHGVGRAFGITATLAPISGLFLNLGLPRVVDRFRLADMDDGGRLLLFRRGRARVVR